ncbi:hypothetical protein ACFSMW_02335 [Virgibacillus halophilus]|uniref:Uncharacterized protein n=1 Tax=Tigheibacillus halophilus TaxID=361280 RepID=A0ABU5CB73_9BACI|nr:hypothetical protein [Virgibacillus halophilus]
MELTPKQRVVLISLTTEWQTPIQLTNQLPKASGDLPDVQEALKELLSEGLVQTNPVVIGLYRLTTKGIATKGAELDKSQ